MMRSTISGARRWAFTTSNSCMVAHSSASRRSKSSAKAGKFQSKGKGSESESAAAPVPPAAAEATPVAPSVNASPPITNSREPQASSQMVRMTRLRVHVTRAMQAVGAEEWVTAEEGLKTFLEGVGLPVYHPQTAPEKEALLREKEEESRSQKRKAEAEARRRARAEESAGNLAKGSSLDGVTGLADVLSEAQSRVLDESVSSRRVEAEEDVEPRTREELQRMAGGSGPTEADLAQTLFKHDCETLAELLRGNSWASEWLLEIVIGVTSTAEEAGSESAAAVRTALRQSFEGGGDVSSLAAGVLWTTLGYAQQAQGKRQQADVHYLRGLQHLRQAGPGASYFLANGLLNHSALLYDRWLLFDAESSSREALAIVERLYGPQHEITAAATNNLAGYLYALKKYEETRTLAVRVLESLTDRAGAHSEYAQTALLNAVSAMKELGASNEEITAFREQWRLTGTPDLLHRMAGTGSGGLDLGVSPSDDDVERLMGKFMQHYEGRPLDPAGLFKDRQFAQNEFRDFVRTQLPNASTVHQDALFALFNEFTSLSEMSPSDKPDGELLDAVVEELLRSELAKEESASDEPFLDFSNSDGIDPSSLNFSGKKDLPELLNTLEAGEVDQSPR